MSKSETPKCMNCGTLKNRRYNYCLVCRQAFSETEVIELKPASELVEESDGSLTFPVTEEAQALAEELENNLPDTKEINGNRLKNYYSDTMVNDINRRRYTETQVSKTSLKNKGVRNLKRSGCTVLNEYKVPIKGNSYYWVVEYLPADSGGRMDE